MNSPEAKQGGELVLGLGEPLIAPLVARPFREAVLVLWGLDRRLAGLARSGREPALRQIKLRWWGEQIERMVQGAIPSEPLLAMVAERLLGRVSPELLVALSEGWEAEAADGGEDLPDGARGVALFALTAQAMGAAVPDAVAGRTWAMADSLLSRQAVSNEAWQVVRQALAGARLSALPRPLAALTAMVGSIAARGGQRSRVREQLAILRVGLVGR